MSDPTTETTESVDTPSPVWPGPLSTVPAATDVPQESAVEAANLARNVLADVLAYREQVAPVLDAGAPLPVEAFEDVAAARRSVAIVGDVLARRGFAGATMTANLAARVVERIAGRLVLRDTTLSRETLGNALNRCRAMAAGTDEEFEAAVEACVSRGAVTWDMMVAALSAGGLDAAEDQQRATLARLAGNGWSPGRIADVLALSADRVVELAKRYGITMRAEPVEEIDAGYFVPAVIEALAEVSKTAGRITPAALAAVSPEQAADWSRELWDALVPLVGLRTQVDQRGRNR